MYLYFLYFFFFWLAVQNLVLPWVYRQQLLPAAALGFLMAAKEGILALSLLTLAYRFWKKGWRLTKVDKFAMAYTALLVFYLFAGPWFLGGTASFALRMISLRGLVSLVLFYFFGRLSFLNLRELRHLVWFIVGLQVVAALFGLYEWFFLPASFWSDTVGIGTFMLDIKGLLEGQNVASGLPSNMYQFGIRRLISSYGDPLAMGIASVFPLLLCIAVYLRDSFSQSLRRCWIVMAAVIAGGLLLTIGRESIGAAAMGVLGLLWLQGKLRQIWIPVAIAVIGGLLLPQLWSYVAETVTFREASAETHLRFLQAGWTQLSGMLAGKGLGEAGGWAFSLAGVQSEVGENSYVELMSQTGMVSVVLLVGFLFMLARTTFHYSRKFPDPLISAAFFAAAAHVCARSLSGIFSPSLFGVIPLASFFFFCGAGITTMQRTLSTPTVLARRVLVLQRSAQC